MYIELTKEQAEVVKEAVFVVARKAIDENEAAEAMKIYAQVTEKLEWEKQKEETDEKTFEEMLEETE